MLEQFFSAMGAGACVVLMMLILKEFYYSAAARAFFVLIFGGFVYLCHGWLPKDLWLYAYLIESSTPAFFWISSRLIFQEGKPLPLLGCLIAVYSFVIPALVRLLGVNSVEDPEWLIFVTRTIPQWLEYLLIVMGGWVLLKGREDDLVESRRRLRWAIMGAAGVSLGWSIFSFNFHIGSAASRIFAIDLSILIIIWFLFTGRRDIWGGSHSKASMFEGNQYASIGLVRNISESTPIGISSNSVKDVLANPITDPLIRADGETVSHHKEIIQESDELKKVKAIMLDGFYRRENLTLKDLAQVLDVPEYKIRAVINKQLGYRNFNEFINEYRIAEAAQRLIDEPETPISNIALDVGYRTLSSFNRAFRKEKNTTPTTFRDKY